MVTLVVALQYKSSNLSRQLARDSDSRLSQVTRPSCQNTLFVTKLTLHIPYTPYYIQTLIPTKCRELPERILREKPQRKTRLTHPQSSSFDFPNSSTLTLSIVTYFRSTLAKKFSHHTHICEEAIWCLRSSQEGTNLYWLMLWAIAGSGKLEKTKVRRNLVQARSLEGLGTLDRLGLEGLLLFMYPNFILQWIIDRLEGGGEVLCRVLRFPLR